MSESLPVHTGSSLFPLIRKGSESDRGHWNSKAEFVLSCIGYSVGLGNLWRFPYLAYVNGGGAFFIPYIILQILVGVPMYFLELSLGQFSGQGPVGVFVCNPCARGVGFAMILTSFVISTYYNIIIAYTLYYMFASMQSIPPWNKCSEEWVNRYNCFDRWNKGKSISIPMCGSNVTSSITDKCKCSHKISDDFNISVCPNATSSMSYDTLVALNKTCPNLIICQNNTHTPASIYFYHEVIQMSGTLEAIGTPNWKLVLCSFSSWVIVSLCIVRGVLSSGRVVYFTATFPYFVILGLLVRAASLDGSLEGMRFLLKPEWSKLIDEQVWLQASGQIMFSLGIAMGPVITYGSYNRFRNNMYMDAMIISSIDLMTSFVAGLVVFSTLGAMAHELNLEVEHVAEKSFGLVFVVYPEAIAQLPAPHFWGVFFFFMLFCLGVDSEFGIDQTLATFLMDEYPHFRKYRKYVILIGSSVMFLVGLPLTTPAGVYVLRLMDMFAVSYSLILVCVCELVAISWVYGVKNVIQDIQLMLGFSPRPVYFWMVTWTFIAPVIVFCTLLVGLIEHEPLTYENGDVYSTLFRAVGWCIMIVILSPMPIVFVKTVYSAPGQSLWKKIIYASSPCDKWRSQKALHLRCSSSLEINDYKQPHTIKVYPISDTTSS